jgi:anthranilate synthase component 2
MKSILLVDNHDSFTWNLAELLRQNRKITFNIFLPENLKLEDVEKYDKIIFSPGPGLPDEFPVMKRILENYYKTKPVLGVCLGHQAIGLFFGARLVHLEHVVHGQVRHLQITKLGQYLFQGIGQNMEIGLYHSWMVDRMDFPISLEVVGLSEDGHIMALCHRKYDICGVQFHPESIITKHGKKLLDNWIEH